MKAKASQPADNAKIRLDKWLWAARFFKTRAIAKQAIEGGKIQYDGGRAKPSRVVEQGVLITIKQGLDEKCVEVLVLSDQRRGAPEAQLLYRETSESIAKREAAALQRSALKGAHPLSDQRPNKKQRRQLLELKGGAIDH